MIDLRDYQIHAHQLIINGFKQNKKLLLVMSTGAGKSKTAISFIDKYKQFYNFVLVVRRRGLVLQLEKDLKEFNLEYGIFMNGHSEYCPSRSIQLCSIDTITSRGFLPHCHDSKDLVFIIDEADESNADSYQEMIKTYFKREGRTFMLGLTATAFDAALPHFDEAITPISAAELNKRKMLVDYIYFIPRLVDYSDIAITKGEFSSKDINRVFNSPNEIETNFKQWLSLGDNRQTLVFCSSQDHAKNVREYINNYYGFRNAQEVDASTPDNIRDFVYNEFKKQEIKFLINVRLITRGVDIPEIGCILDLAPTLKINLHIQKLGRGSRPNKLYDNCIIIDAANNCVNNGHFYKLREINLKQDRKIKRSELGEELRVCSNCFRGADPVDFGLKNICPFCDFVNKKPKKKRLSAAKEKELFLKNASVEQIERLEMGKFYRKELWKLLNLGRNRYSKNIAIQKAKEKVYAKFGKNI